MLPPSPIFVSLITISSMQGIVHHEKRNVFFILYIYNGLSANHLQK